MELTWYGSRVQGGFEKFKEESVKISEVKTQINNEQHLN